MRQVDFCISNFSIKTSTLEGSMGLVLEQVCVTHKLAAVDVVEQLDAKSEIIVSAATLELYYPSKELNIEQGPLL
ncbi:hypothetical protein UY3_05904 [Chelonia mydas]|uniref:Uncharacterized protein n=1 Tax=Chelonia mydas TaxID=8469 RepID=M7BIB0_CHEMY|nr:hypothetical protein UY3_05904 [Chelonia mydas]